MTGLGYSEIVSEGYPSVPAEAGDDLLQQLHRVHPRRAGEGEALQLDPRDEKTSRDVATAFDR